jgi:hypothetical protein
MKFAALVDAPLTALGLSSSDADALEEAIVHLAHAKE